MLIERLLNRIIGDITENLMEIIKQLALDKLKNLGVELLDFTNVEDLETWLNQNQA